MKMALHAECLVLGIEVRNSVVCCYCGTFFYGRLDRKGNVLHLMRGIYSGCRCGAERSLSVGFGG